MIAELGGILFCILLSAAFSAAETAITSFGELKAEHLTRRLGVRGRRHGHVLRMWLEDPTRVLTTILVGNTLVNILGSALATDVALRFFPEAGVPIAAALMTVLVLVFGEVIPKVFARAYSERVVLGALHFVRAAEIALYPAVALLSGFARNWLRRSGAGTRPSVTEEELAFLVELSARQGALEKEKKRLLENVFEFSNTVVREVMIPRMDMVTVAADSRGTEAVQVMLDLGHSRLPVHDGKVDHIVGIVHAKDLLKKVKESGSLDFPVRAVAREPVFIPEVKPLDELLLEMRRNKNQMAIVLDEYGGTAGLITFEDLMEELVGEIRDEYDELEEDVIQPLGENRFLISAGINYADFEKIFGDTIGEQSAEGGMPGQAQEYDTLGGMITDRLGHIPLKGETLRLGRLEFLVSDAGRRRVKKIQLAILKDFNESSRAS